jgi:hypothetical protein
MISNQRFVISSETLSFFQTRPTNILRINPLHSLWKVCHIVNLFLNVEPLLLTEDGMPFILVTLIQASVSTISARLESAASWPPFQTYNRCSARAPTSQVLSVPCYTGFVSSQPRVVGPTRGPRAFRYVVCREHLHRWDQAPEIELLDLNVNCALETGFR